jgi:hypothetical protein
MAVISRGFKGNLLLRRAGVPPDGGYTAERMAEIFKCAEDPVYFFRNYVLIKHVDYEKKVKFDPRGYQLEMITSILENRNTISRWPRQCGKTTVLAAITLHYILFQRNYSILIAAHVREKSQDIVASVQDMYMELPSWLQQGIIEWNKRSFRLENGSRVKASATTVSSARGDTYNMIMLDEFAFVMTHLADEFLKSVIPTVSSGKDTKIVITSTPRGLNMFWTVWESAIKQTVPPPNHFVPIAVEWDQVPGRDAAFREAIIKQYGQEYWDQEFACAFLGSSATLIAAAKLITLSAMQPIQMTESTRLYEAPIKGHLYATTVDVAEGLGGDASVVMVFDVTVAPYKPVYIYQNRYIDTMALPGLISEVARSYNDAMVLVESNFGQMVADILWRDFEYEHVIFTERTIKNPGGFKVGWGSKRQSPGVQMNVLTKRIGCSNLKSMIENDQLIIRDGKTIEELRRFAVKGKSYAAEQGNDDLVMCLVLFGWLSEQGYLKSQNEADIRGQIASINRQKIENDMLVTHHVDPASDEAKVEADYFRGFHHPAPVASSGNDNRWLEDKEDPVMEPSFLEDLERFERWK